MGTNPFKTSDGVGFTCYRCGKQPPYMMAGERTYLVGADPVLVMVCADCIDEIVRPMVQAKYEGESTGVTVRDILTGYLRQQGFDGLWSDNECACTTDDLRPCDGIQLDCAAGFKIPCDCGDHDWHIGPRESVPIPAHEEE